MDLQWADPVSWLNASSELSLGKHHHEKDICAHASYHHRINDPGEPMHMAGGRPSIEKVHIGQ